MTSKMWLETKPTEKAQEDQNTTLGIDLNDEDVEIMVVMGIHEWLK